MEAAAPAAPDSADGQSRKRSRWGGKKEEPADPLLMAVQMGIPLATLQHMSAKQQESLPAMKQRVDEIDLLLRLPDCGVSEVPLERRSPSASVAWIATRAPRTHESPSPASQRRS